MKSAMGLGPTQNRCRPKQREGLPFLCIINEPQQCLAPGLLIGYVLMWLLRIISQGGKGTNNNMGAIKCKWQSHRTQGSLSPQKRSLAPNCKSCYAHHALNGSSCLTCSLPLPIGLCLHLQGTAVGNLRRLQGLKLEKASLHAAKWTTQAPNSLLSPFCHSKQISTETAELWSHKPKRHVQAHFRMTAIKHMPAGSMPVAAYVQKLAMLAFDHS